MDGTDAMILSTASLRVVPTYPPGFVSPNFHALAGTTFVLNPEAIPPVMIN